MIDLIGWIAAIAAWVLPVTVTFCAWLESRRYHRNPKIRGHYPS